MDQIKSIKPNIDISDNPAKEAGKYINDIFMTNINKPFLFLIGGGSSLEVLENINPEFIPENLTVAVTDERFTDDMEDNNFDKLQTTKFYADISEVDSYCINTSVFAGDNIQSHANRFEKNIKDWVADFPDGKIIGLFGIGQDGHTAGIIPNIYTDDEFDRKFNGDSFVEVVEDNSSDAKFRDRVTTTFTFIKKIDFPIFFAKGENKRIAIKKALDSESKLNDTPASIISHIKNSILFTNINI